MRLIVHQETTVNTSRWMSDIIHFAIQMEKGQFHPMFGDIYHSTTAVAILQGHLHEISTKDKRLLKIIPDNRFSADFDTWHLYDSFMAEFKRPILTVCNENTEMQKYLVYGDFSIRAEDHRMYESPDNYRRRGRPKANQIIDKVNRVTIVELPVSMAEEDVKFCGLQELRQDLFKEGYLSFESNFLQTLKYENY